MHPAFKIFVFVFVVVVVCFALPLTLILIKRGDFEAAAAHTHKSDWTNLGTPSDGSISGTATLMKRTDPETGATIYVLVGINQGSIFVLPAQEKAR